MATRQGFAPVALLLIVAAISVGLITFLERNNSFSTASVKGTMVVAQGSEEISPSTAQRIAASNSNLSAISMTELVDVQSPTNKTAFKVSGIRNGNLLGIPISFPINVSVGAQTGQVVDVNQPFWVNLIDFLIR